MASPQNRIAVTPVRRKIQTGGQQAESVLIPGQRCNALKVSAEWIKAQDVHREPNCIRISGGSSSMQQIPAPMVRICRIKVMIFKKKAQHDTLSCFRRSSD